jgi:predicted Rossmann fold flavoprotein
LAGHCKKNFYTPDATVPDVTGGALSGCKESHCHGESHDAGKTEDYDLIIVGAGPSGLFCAINCMQEGKKILVLEKRSSPGHKLLISGSGRCNITHDGDMLAFLDHFGDHGKARFLRPALLSFSNRDLISFFGERGLGMVREKGDKIFPETMQAADVLNILIEQCRAKGVGIRCDQVVRSIARTADGFLVLGESSGFRCHLLVIATGGCSYPATGSSGDGHRFAALLGHRIVEIGPALTPLLIKDHPFSDLAGLSFPNMTVSLYRQGKVQEHRGDVLFTHQGLSGPGILDLSRNIRAGDVLKLSFVPEDKRVALEEWLIDRARQDGGQSLLSTLANLPHSVPLSPRLMKRILKISGMAEGLHLAQMTREKRKCLIDNLTGLPMFVSSLCGFNTAMVTRGGVDTKEVNPKTMQSRLVKGLYLVGEVLDVDGDTGGYNLQAAFSTAMLAARSIRSNL